MHHGDDEPGRFADDHGQPRKTPGLLRPDLGQCKVAADPQDPAIATDSGIQVMVVQQVLQIAEPDSPLLPAPPGMARFIRHL
jgi:hypothetical protein